MRCRTCAPRWRWRGWSRPRQPRLWDFCLKLRRKDAVWAEIGSGRPFVHLSGRYPVERGCLAIVWPLAPHPTNKNEVIVWDLAQDPRELAGLDAETVRRRLYTRQDELPAGEQRLPIKTIHVNKSPIVIGNLKTLGGAAQRWGLDVDAALRHAGHAQALGRTLDGLWPQVFARPAEAQAPDVDEDLYGGFVPNEDRRTLQRLRELDPTQLAAKRPAFHDARLEELLFRYRARNFPETLDEAGAGALAAAPRASACTAVPAARSRSPPSSSASTRWPNPRRRTRPGDPGGLVRLRRGHRARAVLTEPPPETVVARPPVGWRQLLSSTESRILVFGLAMVLAIVLAAGIGLILAPVTTLHYAAMIGLNLVIGWGGGVSYGLASGLGPLRGRAVQPGGRQRAGAGRVPAVRAGLAAADRYPPPGAHAPALASRCRVATGQRCVASASRACSCSSSCRSG